MDADRMRYMIYKVIKTTVILIVTIVAFMLDNNQLYIIWQKNVRYPRHVSIVSPPAHKAITIYLSDACTSYYRQTVFYGALPLRYRGLYRQSRIDRMLYTGYS